MFSDPSLSVTEWINALIAMVITVGIIIGFSIWVAGGIIKILGSDEESQDKKVKTPAPPLPKKTRTAA